MRSIRLTESSVNRISISIGNKKQIDLSFIIKLQEININVCEEYETEREARGPNRTERDDRGRFFY